MRIIHPDEKAYAARKILQYIGGRDVWRGSLANRETKSYAQRAVWNAQRQLVSADVIEADLPAMRLEFIGWNGAVPEMTWTDKPFDPNAYSFGWPSACVLIECPVTQNILSVSRRNDWNAMGLPGGSLENGESTRAGALRELREETGIVLKLGAPIVEAFWWQGCVTYKARQMDIDFVVPREHNGGRVAWVSRQEMVSHTAPFNRYNERLFRKIDEEKAQCSR